MVNVSLSKKIIVIDNLLKFEECDNLIEYFSSSCRHGVYRDTLVMDLGVTSKCEKYDPYMAALKIEKSINEYFDFIEIDWCQIVKWDKGSKQDFHFDWARSNTVFTSITYLNDGYLGGKTMLFEDITFRPKKGRTVFFDGNYYLHGVSEITEGTRFTLPIWYKNRINNEKNKPQTYR